jgi:tyrosyl-tRNA synthetase
MAHTMTATNVLDTLRDRGFIAQVSDEPALRRALDSGPITLYQGFDPTATSLHTGNLVGIMALAHFQRAGHRPIAIVGGGTGMIGDASGHNTERALLSTGQIDRNLAGIRRQFERYLDFSNGRALVINNADWLLGLRYIEFLRDVGRHFTVNQLMQHGTYRERYEGQGISFIEFNYALIQAYDFLHLYRTEGCGEAFALTTPLIETSSGQKMSKSAGNAPWLDPEQTSPYDYYQYWRNTEDQDVGRFLRLFTFLPLDEIAEFEQRSGADINATKDVLAFEATRITHGDEAARKAQRTAQARFGGHGVDEGPSVVVRQPKRLEELAVEAGLVDSLSDAKRHIRQGGLRLNGQPQARDRIVDPSELPLLLSLGKRSVRLIANR